MMATLRNRKNVENRLLASGGKVRKAGINKEEVHGVADPKVTLHEEELEDKLPDSSSSWSFIDDLMQGEADLAFPNGSYGDEGAGVGEKKSDQVGGIKARLRVKGSQTRSGKSGFGDQNSVKKEESGRAAPTVVRLSSKAENETSKAEEGNRTTVKETRAGRKTKNSLEEGKAIASLMKSSNSRKTKKDLNPSWTIEKKSKKAVVKSKKTVGDKKIANGSREKTDKKTWIEAMKAQGVRKSTAPEMIQKLKVESMDPAIGRKNLPPLPEEAELFTPQVKGKNLEQCCTELLIYLDDLEVGESFSVQQMSLLLEGCDERKLVLICEVLEALAMVRRTGSDLEWLGRGETVDEQLVCLHQAALEQDILQQIHLSCNGGMANDEGGEDTVKFKRKLSNLELAQKLVMIFLAAPEPRTLNLAVACKVIYAGLKQPVVAQAWLAEIAIVLVALGLLRKVFIVDSTNPRLKVSAYQFVGPTVEVVEN